MVFADGCVLCLHHMCVVAVISAGWLRIINQSWLTAPQSTFNTERNMASLNNMPEIIYRRRTWTVYEREKTSRSIHDKMITWISVARSYCLQIHSHRSCPWESQCYILRLQSFLLLLFKSFTACDKTFDLLSVYLPKEAYNTCRKLSLSILIHLKEVCDLNLSGFYEPAI